MKNRTLLKVLSATAIFSAVAAIEAYDQDNFAFAADETPVVTNATSAPTTNSSNNEKPTSTTATPAANSATAPSTAPATTTPKAEEPATVAQDVKALKDGEYKITAEALKFYEEGPSMAAAGLDNEKTKLIVKNGQYSVSVTFKPINKPIKKDSFTGYLGDLKYYDGDKTHNNRYEIKDTKENSEFKETNIVENYTEKENDEYTKIYKENFPNRTVYPKTFTYNVDKNKIDTNNKLETYTKVFIPVMEALNTGSGTQKMILKFDLSSLARTKVTADNYEAATYKNPNKDVEYKGTIKKGFGKDGIHVQGHFRNANNNDEESHYGSALDSYVRVEKVGDKYKYTLRFKKGLANVGGEFYPFELKKLAYEGKDVPFTTLAKNADSSINEASITTDKLLEKIQLDGTAPYPNGVLMSHFVTLQLYYETATPYKERPAKLEEVVVPAKPKPVTPAPVKPKEEPKPAKPTFPDHVVSADKVPTTFPTTVKGELYTQQDNTISGYAPLLEKDITIEKVDNKYKYTFNVKENYGTTFSTKIFKYQFTKIVHNGTDASLEKINKKTKKVTLMTDKLLDIIPINTTFNSVNGTGEAALYLKLDFPTVEKVKEEAANNSVPSKIYDASVANKLSMANGALVHEKTRVEKVNDTYHYYLTFKDLRFGTLVGTVDTLTVDNTAAQRSDLGGENHEKVFHFTSPEKLTEKTIRFSVSVNGKPFASHSNVPATLKFNWDGATPLTADQVTSLHNDETTKAQAEKERLEKEIAAKAEKEKAETERLAKEKAERLAKEKAEKAKAEKERLAKEKADREKADRLAKEKADREKAEAEKLAKEKALKEAIEKVQAENKKAEEQAKAAKDIVTNLETAKSQLEKLVKEKEEAINNATTEVEKEKLTTEKAAVEKELTAKVTELKTETEKAVKLENKVKEIEKLEELKNETVKGITTDKSLSKEEAKQLETIVKTASLKDTLVGKVEGTTEEIKVSFDNKDIQASNLVVKKADKKTVAKVEELVKNTDENLSVVKTIDLHFEDSKHNVINKQGETRTVTVTVVANKDEELEVYYVNEDKVNEEKLEKVPSVYKDGKLTFFTSHFSKYTIVKKDKTVPSDQNTPVPAPSDKNEEMKSDKGKALVQPNLPELNINELSKEQNVKEEAEATAQNIFGQVDNKENKNVEVEKTVAQNTSQTAAKGLKQLAKTGLNATATAGLGVLALLSALVLRRRNNK